MLPAPLKHYKHTAKLAKSLSPKTIYNWLMEIGYYPENYVLPPCFTVSKHPKYGKRYYNYKRNKFNPPITQYREFQLPKNQLSDRTFGIIAPEHYSDIAYALSKNWKLITNCLFHRDNKVCSYSFPISITKNKTGELSKLRSGRMIYEYIEMAENDLTSIAYKYKYIISTDIKNFYPSIYTHSIPWALHGKKNIREKKNRYNYNLVGNRLDKLFQYCNDGCTNGIPIGPVVSDIISEIILSAADTQLSKYINDEVIVVRFKDDYRFLAKSKDAGYKIIKHLQRSLREYKLELNEGKTSDNELPNGLFRPWVSQYHAANPNPKYYYSFKRFKEVLLSVVSIDENNPGTGVIDRFLADIVTSKYRLRVQLTKKSQPKIISLLLMLGELRTKAFPKILAIIEEILKTSDGSTPSLTIAPHIEEYLNRLRLNESDNVYLLTWLCYFIKANKLDKHFSKKYKFNDDIVQSTFTSRRSLFKNSTDFKIFTGVKTVSRNVSMLRHLDVFRPQ